MPGMIDTHRHMWQTAMRGYGADWTLTQYFVWYYLEHGKTFRPAGHPRRQRARPAIESLDAGVTTTVDWSHGLQTTEHADAAVDALQLGARPVRARLRQHPGRAVGVVGAAGVPRLRQPADHPGRRHARLPDGLRRHRRPDLPGAGRLRGGPRARRPGDHARRRLGRHQRRRHPAHLRQRLRHPAEHLRARRHARARTRTSGSPPPAARCRCRPRASRAAGQGYPPTWTLRSHDIPVSLSMDTSVWWSGDLFSAMRTTLGADRSREHLRGARQGRDGDQLPPARRPGRRVGDPGRGQGARPGRRRRPAEAGQ